MKILLITGARPDFMKIAPIHRESPKCRQVACQVVHTHASTMITRCLRPFLKIWKFQIPTSQLAADTRRRTQTETAFLFGRGDQTKELWAFFCYSSIPIADRSGAKF